MYEQRLCNRDILENVDDIYFLRSEEIELATQNKADFNIKKIVVHRRAEYEKNKSVTAPKVIIGKFNLDGYTPNIVELMLRC